MLLMGLSVAPLVWTAISNPSSRVHYGGWFPFSIFFVALAFERALPLAPRIAAWSVSKVGVLVK